MKNKRLRIRQLRLTSRESIRLAELVLNPPPRNKRFSAAMARYQDIKSRSVIAHVTPGGGNVFLDLGFAPELAAKLKAESDSIIRSKLSD